MKHILLRVIELAVHVEAWEHRTDASKGAPAAQRARAEIEELVSDLERLAAELGQSLTDADAQTDARLEAAWGVDS